MNTISSKAPKSVYIVGSFLSAGGVSSTCVCEQLATRLQGAGWIVTCASSQQNKLLRLFDMMGKTWTQRDRYRVAQVEIYSGLAFIWAECVTRMLHLMGKPYVVVLHGGALPQFAKKNPFRVGRLLASATRVVAPSNYLRAALKHFREDIQVIPNPLDISRYPYQPRASVSPNLMWLRAFHSVYNPEMAVRVLHFIRSQHAGVRLRMIGPDKGDGTLARCRELAVELGVTDHIQFLPGVPKAEVGRNLSKGEIFLNTTNIDNTPVSVIEAMACGLPVVTTNVGGIPFMLRDKESALFVKPGDVTQMASAIDDLVAGRLDLLKLTANGRAFAESCDWATVLPAWEQLFSEIMDKNHV